MIAEYFGVIWRRKWIIILLVVSAVATAYAVSKNMQPVYEAQTTLMVGEQPLSFSESWRVVQANTVITKTYSKMVTSSPVLKRVIEKANLDLTPAELSTKVGVSQVYETAFIQITVSDPNPSKAKDLANTLADVFVEYNKELHINEVNAMRRMITSRLKSVEKDLRKQRETIAKLLAEGKLANEEAVEDVQMKIRQLESEQKILNQEYDDVLAKSIKTTDVRTVEPAETPQAPVRPRPRMYTLVALVASSFGGIGLAFFLESLGESRRNRRKRKKIEDEITTDRESKEEHSGSA